MNDTIRQTDTIRQGVFDQQTPNNGTTSRIGSHVSPVGVLQNAQDLVSHEYQLVLHSIKQDLSAVLQRQANTSVIVDWELLMQPGAPHELKDILQGLVYVAKIKDVANTRGGAQVSQHRRVLAQQTYNMLVQELSDVLQGQEVQRSLRDLTTASDHRPRHNKSKDPTVESNVVLSTSHTGMEQNMPTLDLSTFHNVKSESDDEMSGRTSSIASSLAREMLPYLDENENGVKMQDEILEIQQQRARDDANTQEKIQNVRERLTQENDETETQKLNKKLLRLSIVLDNRKQKFDSFLKRTETYNHRVQELHERINKIRETRGRIQNEDDPHKLITDIDFVKQEHGAVTEEIKNYFDFLRSEEERDEV